MREFEGSPSPAEYINIMVDESSIISKIEHYEKQKVEISKWINITRILLIIFVSLVALGTFVYEEISFSSLIAFVFVTGFFIFIAIVACKFLKILLCALCDQVIETCEFRIEARK